MVHFTPCLLVNAGGSEGSKSNYNNKVKGSYANVKEVTAQWGPFIGSLRVRTVTAPTPLYKIVHSPALESKWRRT